eukprot:scaffold89202_cov69-Phaeocystis_antarctica.AAC.6
MSSCTNASRAVASRLCSHSSRCCSAVGGSRIAHRYSPKRSASSTGGKCERPPQSPRPAVPRRSSNSNSAQRAARSSASARGGVSSQ